MLNMDRQDMLSRAADSFERSDRWEEAFGQDDPNDPTIEDLYPHN